ncbi:hypothetical protein ElyMa_004467400 [Elysia marginata]|uniref:Uncharacterized protein n=1 Tax=Elysia marginata TaxID=1093978 RepID=A0AAV4HHY5_9GAST|nr:hypothetical protein ElyMa_004467400 [Elysia marginata]
MEPNVLRQSEDEETPRTAAVVVDSSIAWRQYASDGINTRLSPQARFGRKGSQIERRMTSNEFFSVQVNFGVMSGTALGTIESVLPKCDVRSACIHHTQSHYPDTGPTILNTKSIMQDSRRISC